MAVASGRPTAARSPRGRLLRLAGLTVAISLLLLEGLSAVVIAVISPHLSEPIRRTRGIFAEQTSAIRELFLSGVPHHVMFDSVLGWRYRPGHQEGPNIVNADGLHSRRVYAALASPGTRRLAAFGDSFVYCNEVGVDECWTSRMEQADGHTEVLNFGVGGYGIDQALLRYLHEGRGLAAETVILGFTTDDLRRLVNVYRRFLSSREIPLFKPRFAFDDHGGLRLLPTPVPRIETYADLAAHPRGVLPFGRDDHWYQPLIYENPLYDWSATVRLLTNVWLRVRDRYFDPDRIWTGQAFNEHSTAFRLQIALFQAFADSARAYGHVPVIVLLPDRTSLGLRERGLPTLYSPLTRALQAHGLGYLDTADAFERRGFAGGVDRWFNPGGHYSPEGNAVVAAWLREQLLARPELDSIPGMTTRPATAPPAGQ